MAQTQHKVIAVCGKGGVGKTAVTTLLTRALKGKDETGRLLVVDADPALGLLYALNVRTDKTIGAVRDKVLAAAESGNAGEQCEVADELDYLITSSLQEEKDYAFLAMGHMDSKGCFCSVNKLLREALEQLVDKFDTVLIDGEAGIEQINRQVVEKVNTLVIVTDSSYRGVQTVHHIAGLIEAGNVPACEKVGVLFNRIQGDDRTLEELEKAAGLPVFGVIDFDPMLAQYDAQARTLLDLPDDAVSVKAIEGVLAKL